MPRAKGCSCPVPKRRPRYRFGRHYFLIFIGMNASCPLLSRICHRWNIHVGCWRVVLDDTGRGYRRVEKLGDAAGLIHDTKGLIVTSQLVWQLEKVTLHMEGFPAFKGDVNFPNELICDPIRAVIKLDKQPGIEREVPGVCFDVKSIA